MSKTEKENRIVLLLKSMKNEYVNDTLTKGRFCFNHPVAFNVWESKDAAQYDPWDAHSAYDAIHLVYAPIIGEENGMPVYGQGHKFADKAFIHEQSGAAKHSPICCFRFIEENEVMWSQNGFEFSLGETADRIINEFGHDSYIIIQAKPFIERVQKQCPSSLLGAVAYHDKLNNYQFPVPEEIKERVEQLFRKDERYSWQKEYRIALPPTKNSPVFLELGSIEDIAISGKIADLRN